MSKRRLEEDYKNSLAFKLKTWYRGEKDPFTGVIEMKPQDTRRAPARLYEPSDYEESKAKAWNLEQNKRLKRSRRLYVIQSIIGCLAIILILIYAVSFLPPVGNASNPTNNEVPKRYIEEGLQDTGAVNIVTGMILTYRAFDTFGETTVLFIATCCVMILLMIEKPSQRKKLGLDDFGLEPHDDIILQKVAKVICPCIFLFGIYVILNGHLSPGGGFSGGAIIGAGMILHAAAFDFPKTQKFFNEHIYVIIKVTALLLYGLIAIYYFFTGANGFPSIFPTGTAGAILSGGIILPINICVGTEVACTIYAFFALFRRGGL